MKKAVKVILIILLIVGILVAGVIGWNLHKKKVKELEDEIATLELTISQIGQQVQVMAVATDVSKGLELTEADIVWRRVNAETFNDNYVVDLNDLKGSVTRIDVTANSVITRDMLTKEDFTDTTRYQDVYVPNLPIALKAGDYVDLRLRLPYGEDYIVLSHKRVVDINNNILKMYLEETEMNYYIAALIDYYLNSSKGAMVWTTVYPEPNLQEPAQVTYSIPKNVLAIVNSNPNILDKIDVKEESDARNLIESALKAVSLEKGNLINSGNNAADSVLDQGDTEYIREQDELIVEEGVVN